ncbi:uncharacterized protein CcaverHIS019_0212350 [Cutaneotrichosporon cavernicola]|uniref:triacylglycerol lipase n=1 Tax=Cutaneotrichosporon cavernicola TaxID=279322 RepID=A0AA48L2P5_9TREE|nr:uncharacterized protein CcaverHIS019_0212350 [Cutaneotrichosporon cavernicola]BEI89873.1 hypothetical protein CcaverHIS019_0212350 [Cutaneotrichosporon cavernicola]BEI97643.1 hypothetical protein CcaverHIS631_0212320 [Cutaneotrichosporon cavernicola]BEJ05421.1 hypothetical protein CcaverHIS641_0212380 [Cutaneotrichosporon cavernicola]
MRIPLITSLVPLIFQAVQDAPPTLSFTPRHAHAVHDGASIVMADTPLSIQAANDMVIRTRRSTIRRPSSRPPEIQSWAKSAHARAAGGNASIDGWATPLMDSEGGWGWEDVEVEMPDTTDRQTLITLAKMAANAYSQPADYGWYPIGGSDNGTEFGWEPDSDGLRGHIFADESNSTVVIAIKGTSAGLLGSGGPTSKNDKFNDNLLFSCCCARVDFSWSTVCDCYAGGYKCEQTCLEKALVEESVYATVGTNLYNNITYMYPNANIWLTGHSLGGALAALIGLSFGAPAIGFEAPGDRLAARRLHLPQPPAVPPEKSGITHVYHTADPIPMGTCTGGYSGCYAAGFALESKCHTGQTILYDTVTVKGWSVDVRTHRIGEVINRVLADPWPVGDEGGDDDDDDDDDQGGGGDWDDDDDDDIPDPGTGWLNWFPWGRGGKKEPKKPKNPDWEKHGGVPKAKAESMCVDCYKWEFGDNWNKK